MDSTDLPRIQRQARIVYELGRLRLAIIGILPAILIVAIATSITHRPVSALWLGVATVAIGVTMLWYGREPQRAVLPGIAAGLIPLVLALCANHIHACGLNGCLTLCVPACTTGGVIAGIIVASIGRQKRAGPIFWVSASGLTLLTGAIGCACIGYSGVVGLAVGFGVGIAPGALRKVFS